MWISTAKADESSSKIHDQFKIGFGAFLITNSETTLRIDSKDVPAGVYINLERQLGVQSDDVVGRVEGYYRFNSHHRLDYGYYPVNRSGTRAISTEIPTNPPIAAGTVVSTTFDTATYKLGYTYSFYNNEKVELGLSAGLHITSFDLSLVATGGSSGASSSADVTAPLPVVGVLLTYNITPDWLVIYNYQAFLLQIEGNKGSLTDTNLSIEYRGFKNVAFGLAVNRVNLNLDFDGENYLGTVNNEIGGFTTYMALYF
ncbi:MAG: hypothetical protein ACC657_17920 [Thiohalomonadales bacterium]